MNNSENEAKSSKNPDDNCSLPISEYVKKLEPRVKLRYLEKISVIGIDPVLIEGKHFEPDCLPPVESTDLLCYLVLETSFTPSNSLKLSKALKLIIRWYLDSLLA